MRPLTTVIVPSFEQGRFLPTALRSILAQSEDSVESLLFDNCSRDETRQVLESIGPRLSRVVIQPDRGQSAALNTGFREARGDILSWLNADDILMPGVIARACDTLERTGADVVYGQCAHLDDAGQFTGYFPFARPFDSGELRNYNNFIPQPATFFRRSLLEASGFLDETLHYAMDWDLWCRFARSGARFEFVPEVWSGARIHAKAKTSRGGLRRISEICRVGARHRTHLVPFVPLLYLAHRANRLFGLHHVPGLLDWWRHATGGDRSQVAHGIAPGSVIVSEPASVSYPVYDNLRRLTIDLDDSGCPPASINVNGKPITRIGRTYEATLPVDVETEAIQIRITGIGRSLPSPFVIHHE